MDIAAVLNAAGAERLLDDGLMHFAHFGSPGWLLQRPEQEKAAVYRHFPRYRRIRRDPGRRSLSAREGHRPRPYGCA